MTFFSQKLLFFLNIACFEYHLKISGTSGAFFFKNFQLDFSPFFAI